RDPDAECPRHRCGGRELPCRDLASVHGAGAGVDRAGAVPRAIVVAGVEAVHTRPVRARVRSERARDDNDDRDHDVHDDRASEDQWRDAEPVRPELLTLDEALEQILSHARPLPVESVALEEANGRVLREAAIARVDLPPFPSSAMDGFAVRAADTPGELPVSFRVAAGSAPPGPLSAGTSAGIATRRAPARPAAR